MSQYHITPLANQILFRIIDLDAPGDIFLPEGVAKKQAAQVIAVGSEVKYGITPGDLLILADGIAFAGLKNFDDEIVHLINDGCVVAKYEKRNPALN
jgi:co-chaperonin GroES (HSP10)